MMGYEGTFDQAADGRELCFGECQKQIFVPDVVVNFAMCGLESSGGYFKHLRVGRSVGGWMLSGSIRYRRE